MLNNFFKVVAEIWKLQQNNLYAVGLIKISRVLYCPFTFFTLRLTCMKKIIIANWKMNPDTSARAVALARECEQEIASAKGLDVVLAPPYPFLREVASVLTVSSLGAQDVFWEESGAYTGEVSVRQLKDAGVEYVIIGHSERRIVSGETDDMVRKKIQAVLEGSMAAILCVGERERSGGEIPAFVGAQVRSALGGIKKTLLKNLIIAYEPVWAISTTSGANGSCTPDMMFRARLAIEKVVADIYDQQIAKTVRIIYGGSVSPENIATIFSAGHMDGALVGSAGLNAEKFGMIVRNASGV